MQLSCHRIQRLKIEVSSYQLHTCSHLFRIHLFISFLCLFTTATTIIIINKSAILFCERPYSLSSFYVVYTSFSAHNVTWIVKLLIDSGVKWKQIEKLNRKNKLTKVIMDTVLCVILLFFYRCIDIFRNGKMPIYWSI